MSKIPYKDLQKGHLLLAEPYLDDPYFKRSVVLLTEHDNEGSLGFKLNHITPLRLQEALPMEFAEHFDAPIYLGGPVRTDAISYIHNVGELLEGSVRISAGVYFGGDFKQLKFLVEAQLIEPKHIRFFRGYSGWEAGQLATEFDEKTWVAADMHANYLFNTKPNTLWRTVMQHQGDTFSIIANMPEEINMN